MCVVSHNHEPGIGRKKITFLHDGIKWLQRIQLGWIGLDWIGFFVFISIIHLKEKAQRLFKEKAQEKQGFE